MTRVVWLCLLLLIPAALATQGTITPLVATPTLGAGHVYSLDLVAGTPTTIELSWATPTADLDLIVIPPRGPDCDPTDPDCLAYIAVELGTGALCPEVPGEYGSMTAELGPAVERVELIAPVTGTYQVWVMAALAVPTVPIDYTLIVEGGEVRDPFETYISVGSPHCKYVYAAQAAGGLPTGSPV